MSFIKRNFRLLLCALAVLLLVTGISAYFGRTAIPTGSWGLSFQKEGQAPIGNATEAALRQYDAVYKADGTEKVLYITFDAGYENGNTSKILDVLKQHSEMCIRDSSRSAQRRPPPQQGSASAAGCPAAAAPRQKPPDG